MQKTHSACFINYLHKVCFLTYLVFLIFITAIINIKIALNIIIITIFLLSPALGKSSKLIVLSISAISFDS